MASSTKYVDTPLMKQYNSIKHKHPDAILLFRVGDFYETFGEDAIRAANILGITLTRRANGAASYVELAGFPYHALDTYLPRLVRAGQRVAVCEQLEDPKLTKKIVKRGITEMVTPGISFNESVLEHTENNFLAGIWFDQNIVGLAFLDISTGEFLVAQGSAEYADKLLSSFKPKEVLIEKSFKKEFKEIFGDKYYIYGLDDWVFTEETANDRLLKQFRTRSLKGFGVQKMSYAVIAAGAIMQYLEITENNKTEHITSLSRIEEENYVWLDKFTIRNLELFQSLQEGARTLVNVLDRTHSPMGARLLRRWMVLPLKDVVPINERLNTVEHLFGDEGSRDELITLVKKMGDVERILSRVSTAKVTPREMQQLRIALEAIIAVKDTCRSAGESGMKKIGKELDPCDEIREKISRELMDDPPNQVNKGNVISEGVSSELDELRSIVYSGKEYLNQIQERESARTSIPSLKIGFNNVFGYYIEVRNTHKDKVPEEWVRKQTLVSAERYITEELKQYEEKILGAEEKILALEANLFHDLVIAVMDFTPIIQQNAYLIAKLDCFLSFAIVASENRYVRPVVDHSEQLDIKQGRHPVIEMELPMDEEYVPNNVFLDTKQQQVIILTGPNMSGKSALLRQTALIVLMAQMGSFVPAESARIGWIDKIFTRVGASDNISLGESTFMVEMNEAASILNNLSERSLILLDEIGRGTATYDGISIAWAMVEFIHEHPKFKAKTLFATHYHELNEMETDYKRVRNFNVSIKELKDRVIFIRKLEPGGSEHSFGIHVAEMAGMPRSVVNRAGEILEELEKSHQKHSLTKPVGDLAVQREGYQTSIFQLDDPVLKQIRDEIQNLDVDNLTPLEALNKLNEIKKITGLD
ncbi:DNA mismatch repair protein MutS [Bacteroidota bacterium]